MAQSLKLNEDSHRRLNPLTGDWVLVSPHRTKRPWQGAIEKPSAEKLIQYDPACYLCPGNSRAGGVQNPHYTKTFVFENDFATLKSDTPHHRVDVQNKGLLVAEGESGICRVLCFSPRHDLTLSTMDVTDIEIVVDTWVRQSIELASLPATRYVQIFENRGAMMGASNPHPHCQVWSIDSIPEAPAKELAKQGEYLQRHGHCLLCEYLEIEVAEKTRIVFENSSFVVLVPFWAVWPFEVLICSRRHVDVLPEFSSAEQADLARILKRLTTTYDRLFDAPFPYSMGFHQAPTDGVEHPEWHFHAHFYPPLLRSATIRKFMVGFEMLGEPQRDITAETAAERLRASDRDPPE
jgi:UDPglucose--hexose-1-phosphate uridylyltransferase